MKKILNNKGKTVEFFFLRDKEGKTISQTAIDFSCKECELCHVYTTPKYRKRGYATRLIQYALSQYGHNKIRLFIDPCETETTNDNNLKFEQDRRLSKLSKFYAKFGFKPSPTCVEVLYRVKE